jgi:general secretion pathway protein I
LSKSPTERAGGADSGFTLIEVLVALAIAALGLGVLMAAASQGLTNVGAADRYVEATRRAEARLATLAPMNAIASGEFSGDDGGGYFWLTRITPLAVYPIAPAAGQAQAGPGNGAAAPGAGQGPLALYAVTVTISWRNGAGSKSVTLQSERLARAGGGQ